MQFLRTQAGTHFTRANPALSYDGRRAQNPSQVTNRGSARDHLRPGLRSTTSRGTGRWPGTRRGRGRSVRHRTTSQGIGALAVPFRSVTFWVYSHRAAYRLARDWHRITRRRKKGERTCIEVDGTQTAQAINRSHPTHTVRDLFPNLSRTAITLLLPMNRRLCLLSTTESTPGPPRCSPSSRTGRLLRSSFCALVDTVSFRRTHRACRRQTPHRHEPGPTQCLSVSIPCPPPDCTCTTGCTRCCFRMLSRRCPSSDCQVGGHLLRQNRQPFPWHCMPPQTFVGAV
mmetsp:Transcript_26493/g.40984  ORF Transcript_26493/g.40984 Transcript_26493/m.40984 type:complete len:285 (-) Transcript_26493:437-1291(-)